MKLENKYLKVMKSKLAGAGYGLFAKVSFEKGARITEYKGRLCRWRDVKDEDGHNGYLLRLSRTMAIDALPATRSMGRYANDARGLTRVRGLRNNAEYVVDGLRCFIEASRNIRKGEEILVGYGQEYWQLIRKLRKEKTQLS
ncbi:MAG: SET domain-containing protein [Bacteroidota bacterium]